MKIAGKLWILLLLCLVLCAGCGRKDAERQESEKTQTDGQKKQAGGTVQEKADADSRADNETITDAMKKTADLVSFKAVTKGDLILGGKTLNGEFGMESTIQAVQGKDKDNLQMIMETRLSPGNAVSMAYYKDGWYYTDDGKRKNKQEKSQEEVLGIITDITDMVIDASDEIENISSEEDGTDKIYSYELPSYIAEDYIDKLMAEMGAEETILNQVSVEVESLKLVSAVNKEGILTSQEIFAAGKVKKAIVAVPVEAHITVDFQETEEQELTMELW